MVVQAPQAEAQQPQPEKKRAAPRRKAAQRKGKGAFVKSKRKQAVARASASTGKGSITVNGFDINVIEPMEYREMMMEPVNFSDTTRGIAAKMDIKVNVYGGGASARAQAVRSAIAKSIVEFSGADSLKREYMHYDRFMIVDDSRRVEPKKFKGPKARARFQKSYR
ncbi:MAG: 30S ribosomal protein S9 [Candidatus Micrarchaeota archaeon]|nr:30S ribosomal protein S9 [Candidatus Micrarchaeota archaeon]